MTDSLIANLLSTLPDAPVHTVLIGSHWTAVVVQVAGGGAVGLPPLCARPATTITALATPSPTPAACT